MSTTADLATVLGTSVPLAVPLLFAGLGEFVAQRAGAFDLSVEGMLLGGAYFGALGASWSGSLLVGVLLGVAAGAALALIHANLSHRLQLNTYVVGLSLNVLVLGLTNYLYQKHVPLVPAAKRIHIPGLSDIPVIGDALFDQHWLVYVLPFLAFVVWLLMRSRIGLEVRGAGDDPVASDLIGVKVNARRRQALVFCGVCSGAGGAYLSIFQAASFTSGMTAGRGYLVIAAVIFGGWTLRGAIAGCFLFGVAQGLQLSLPAIGASVSPQLLVAAPYMLALAVLAVFGRRLREPMALGRPFMPSR